MNWKRLQNGSDIRGVAIDGIEGEHINLTPKIVERLGKAFVTWIRRKKNISSNITVSVGTDSRISGPILKAAFINGLTSSGANVYDFGLCSTPAMYMSTVDKVKPTTAGVMITASHLPFNRNGLKFFISEGGLEKQDINELLEIAEKEWFDESSKKGTTECIDYLDTYSKGLVEYIRKECDCNDSQLPLAGMKIIVDAGNGAGGFFAEKVLKPLGANITGSQFLEPNGMFPNHIPNPENKEAMESICQAVLKEKADLGIIFDTDVDRSAIVDKQGNPINKNSLIALISTIILNEHPNSTIVTDSVTSDGLSEYITALHGKHHRYKRGYKNVINESKRLNKKGEESWIAIETSGHAALKENYFLDDGAFLIAKLLVQASKLHKRGKDLSSLIMNLKHPKESVEYRYDINEENYAEYGQAVLKSILEEIEEIENWQIVHPNYEGIRVSCQNPNEKGWFLLRMSLHDPVMPLNIESSIENGTKNIYSKLKCILSKYPSLRIH